MNEARFWVEIIAAATIPLCILSVVWQRISTQKGLGSSALRFLALGVIVPTTLVLGLEKVLEAGAVGSILGAVVGYLFSSIPAKPVLGKPDA